MSCFTDIENKPDDWLALNPLTILKPIQKTSCDTNLIVLNYLSEFKTEILKLKAKENLGIFTDTILSKNSNNPIANKVVYEEFNKIKSHIGLNSINWTIDSDMNNYTKEGTYLIKGERTRQDDNLPILNSGIISAQLTIINSESVNNLIITQILSLNNNTGGEGNVYVRSCQNGEWKAWGKLQTNIEVGQVNTLDNLTDNGIYSGVFTDGTPTSSGTFYDTFVLIVINNYAVSIPTGNPQSISQLKYSLGLDGLISITSRKRDQYGYWDKWVNLDGKSFVEQEINTVKSNALQYNTLGVNVYDNKAEIYGRSIDNKVKTFDFPVATTEKAGIMSAEDKVNLVNSTATKVTWDSSSNLNDFINAGIYDIKGTRQNVADNLPITNIGENATIAARLIVTVTPEGNTTYRHSVGQTLILSNAEGRETKVYTRNGNRTSYDGGISYTIEWGTWATQQTNTNVGQVDDLDSLTDNGIYSGVWTKGSYNAYPLTFVCVVINDYFVGTVPRRISQFVYGLSKFDGSIIYQSRVWDDSKNAWGNWEILNLKEISLMISNEIKKVTDGVDPEKLDSLKDLIAWVDTHANVVAEIKSGIQASASADSFEFYAEGDKVGLELSANSEQIFSVYIPTVTTETAGVMIAADKKKLDNLAVEGTNVDLNTYMSEGTYFFSSKKLTNVPILNDSIVSARLTVLTAYDGTAPVITQVLNLNNLGGGEGNVYIRSNQKNIWKPWGKLQTNVEVGQITPDDMSNLIDNGIYSGVCVDGATVETFVLIVINNYLAASQAGFGSYISQLKYAIDLNRGNTVKTRTRDAYGIWSEWVSLDEKSLVKEEKERAMEAEAELRSLVSETRNFLDRLMARLDISDAIAVADKIADVIISTTEGMDVESTEVIEE